MVGGLTYKRVNHVIKRPCWWHHPPNVKRTWRLLANKWRIYEKKGERVRNLAGDGTGMTEEKLREIRR